MVKSVATAPVAGAAKVAVGATLLTAIVALAETVPPLQVAAAVTA